ncbi:MAG: DNA-binding protein [Kaiparowitsia implicata GSE-PSE-MK54-09C]|jgi:hypothetical protein|nr:DNA-binding protein [Kaiparowitsia implicata GSE-PSE-MK54-09C]
MKFLAAIAGLTVVLGVGSPLLAQTVPIQSLRQQDGIAISGRVDGVVGNNFTLSDGSGEIIVDAGPRWYQEINIAPGEQLTVVGEYDNGEFDAYRITRASGEVLVIRNGPGRPPWAGGPNRAQPRTP